MSGGPPAGGDLPKAPEPSKTAPIQMIYDQLNSLFGKSSNDIFQLEFPARLLEQGNFLYPGSDTINAQQVKPPAVAEAEFRLSNDLYDVSNIIGGANGGKLSERYREILFSMVTANGQALSTSEQAVRDDQTRICAWLEEEVENFDPPANDLLSGIPKDLGLRLQPPKKYNETGTIEAFASKNKSKISRVDLYQKLLDIYNGEKFRWVQFKNDARPKDFSSQTEVDAYDRLLSTYAPVVDSKLEALWTVLVVRGQYHRVRRYIGFVDIETASEALQRARESLRSSVARSIDDTEDIYPVVMTPSNWAKYLSTNFQPEDLLNEPGIIRDQLYTAEKNRAMLINRQNAIKAGQQDIGKLQLAEVNARKDLSQTQTDMTIGYSDTVIKMVQLYFDAVSAKANDAAVAVRAITSEKGLPELNEALKEKGVYTSPLTQEQFEKLREMQASCLTKQAALTRASEAYNRAQLALAQAQSNDGTNILAQIQDQIDSLTMDIEYYKKVLSNMPNPLGSDITPAGAAAPLKPNTDETKVTPPKELQLPKQTDGASVWQEIVLTYTHNENASATLSRASVSHDEWQTGFWFWSAGGKSDKSEGEKRSTHSTKNTDIKIAFRVMKVSMQRPWLDTGILAKTKDFFRDSTTKIAKNKPADTKDSLTRRSGTGSEDEILPSIPTGFIVAKDVHIILSTAETFDDSYIKDVQSSSNSGGGFLCFSCSKSSSSSDHREAAVVLGDAKHLSIKIAAPQIIGWISELTPEDQTMSSYNTLPKDEFVSKAVKSGASSVTVHGLATPPLEA